VFSLEEFDCVVIGDEPAGLWLLEKLSTRWLSTPTGPRKPKLAWISLASVPDCSLPTQACKPFAIHSSDKWSPEIVTKKESFVWNVETLVKRFPKASIEKIIPESFDMIYHGSQLREASNALKAYPELLGISQGLTRFFTRSESLGPESAILASLLCTEFTQWNPSKGISKFAKCYDFNGKDTPVEKVYFSQNARIAVQLSSREALLAEHVIFNSDFRSLMPIIKSSPDLQRSIDLGSLTLSEDALFELPMKVESNGLPQIIPRMNLFLDTLEIPEPKSEIWPFSLKVGEDSSVLSLWSQNKKSVHLESILESLKAGYQRMNWLFPFLSDHLLSLTVPMDLESCSQEDSRTELINYLETNSIEKYRLAKKDANTRHPQISLLTPNLQCFYPYPCGPLMVAKDLLKQLVQKKKLTKTATQASPPKKFTSRLPGQIGRR